MRESLIGLGFITAGDWDCVVTVKSLPALHHSVDFIFLSFGIIDSILEQFLMS